MNSNNNIVNSMPIQSDSLHFFIWCQKKYILAIGAVYWFISQKVLVLNISQLMALDVTFVISIGDDAKRYTCTG